MQPGRAAARYERMGLPRVLTSVALAAMACLGCGQAARADVERPAAARRVLRLFDFEERPLNQEAVPRHWFRAQNDPPGRIRPGFPSWNKAEFDSSRHVSGSWSVRLPTRGGSTSLRLSSGVLPAIPGADYAVSASIRTEGLKHAAGRLSARFLNERRLAIRESESRSALVRTAGEGWETVSLELPGAYAEAAWIQIDLELLQPIDVEDGRRGAPPRDALAKQRTWEEDYAGAAWFDDVLVSQLPRVELAAAAPGGVFVAPTPPTLRGSVRDLTGERLRTRLTVTDMDGRVESREERALPAGDAPMEWSPKVASLGWRRATLEVLNDEGAVGKASTSFVWLPPIDGRDRPKSLRKGRASRVFLEAAKFGLTADESLPAQVRALPDIARAAGVGAVTLSAWSASLQRGGVRDFVEAMDEVVERLVAGNVAVTLAVGRIPEELSLALQTDPDSALALIGGDIAAEPEQAWTPYLREALNKFGQRVRRWQIGRTGDTSAFYRSALGAELDKVDAAFGRLVPRPTLVVPWGAEQKPDARLGTRRAIAVTLPYGVQEASIEAVVRGLKGVAEPTIVIEPPPQDLFGARASVNALIKRAAAAWSVEAPSLALAQPWDWEGREGVAPHAALAAWRTLSEHLGGRRVVGEMPVARGVRCLILEGQDAGGALLAWNETASESEAVIRMHLGEGEITLFDPFGNASAPRKEDADHVIPLTDAPVFIEGADIPLARFRAGFRVDPGFIPAEAAVHTAEIELSNHWPTPIAGVLRLTDPASWKIEPRVIPFDIPAGKTARFPVDIVFGVGEEAGPKRVRAEADVTADRAYGKVKMAATVEVGLITTQLSASYSIIPDPAGTPRDVSVTLQITNTGSDPVSLQAFALAPGFPREQAPVGALGAGQTAVRRFVFAGGAQRLLGKRIRVGLVDVAGSGRLNKSIMIQ